MHNYWLGIMAVAFVVALLAWILLVFNADRHPRGKSQDSAPRRDVMGGEFIARQGGRQVMPHPNTPEPPAEPPTSPRQQGPEQQAPQQQVPHQRGARQPAEAQRERTGH